MRLQRRAALLSIAIHGVFIAAAASIAAFSVPALRTITIDFSIEKSPATQPAPVAPPQPALRKSPRPAPMPVKEENYFPDTTAKETGSDADTMQFADAGSGEAEEQPVLIASIGTMTPPQPDTGRMRETERQKYLKEQFEYIRDIIYRKAVYPSMALEMKITGTVFLAFCVREDGGVENIGILKGSGASILDRDAVSTIKRAAPFPRPPIRVVVKFPIEYRLE